MKTPVDMCAFIVVILGIMPTSDGKYCIACLLNNVKHKIYSLTGLSHIYQRNID